MNASLAGIARALAVLALASAFLLCLLSAWTYLAMFRRRPKSEAGIEARLRARGLLDGEFLGREWISDTIPSPRGYDIATHALPGGSGRLAVFSHGISWNWLSCLQFAKPFADAGWTVVAYDGRGHGATAPGRRTSFGVHEKDDLRAVIDWALARFDGSGGLILHGTSLGAAVSLQCAGIDPRPVAVIADCPFSSAEAILEWRLRNLLRRGPAVSAVKAMVALLARALDGVRLEDADCGAAANVSDADILFLHALDDRLVPARMSEEMARSRREARPGARTELVLFKNCGHVQCRKADPGLYDRLAVGFAQAAADRGKAAS